MILIVDFNWKKNYSGFNEFVFPINSIAPELEEYVAKHYLEVNSIDIGLCDMIILSGTALKDNVTLNQPEKFSLLSSVEKPVLGV